MPWGSLGWRICALHKKPLLLLSLLILKVNYNFFFICLLQPCPSSVVHLQSLVSALKRQFLVLLWRMHLPRNTRVLSVTSQQWYVFTLHTTNYLTQHGIRTKLDIQNIGGKGAFLLWPTVIRCILCCLKKWRGSSLSIRICRYPFLTPTRYMPKYRKTHTNPISLCTIISLYSCC